MHGDLNAMGLLACVAAPAAILIRASRQRPSVNRVLGSLAGGFVTFFIALVLSVHMCDAGQPLTQMLIPAACLSALTMFVSDARLRRTAILVLFVAAVALALHFSHLVHEPGLTGNPHAGERRQHSLIVRLHRTLATVQTDDAAPVGEGWLQTRIPLDVMNGEQGDTIIDSLDRLDHVNTAQHVWHTWLTGIYATESEPADVWFTGGVLGSDPAQLQVRRMPRAVN